MTPENRNNSTEITPYDQLDLFTEFEQAEPISAVPNSRIVETIKEKIQSSAQSKAELERRVRESTDIEDKLEDQGVTNRTGARIMTGSEEAKQALEKIIDKEKAGAEEDSPHVVIGGSPYPRGKAPGYQRSKKRRYVSSRDRMLGDVAPEHIRRPRGH